MVGGGGAALTTELESCLKIKWNIVAYEPNKILNKTFIECYSFFKRYNFGKNKQIFFLMCIF